MRRYLTLSLALLTTACADTTPEHPAPSTDIEVQKHDTRQQAVVDPSGPNWMLAGGQGLVELVGADGEPDEVTGRFALGGDPIVNADGGVDRWIVVGNGRTQALDVDAQRLREARTALSGDSITFIERGPVGWLIGGANGRVQLLDAEGEPTMAELQVLDNTTVNHAAFNGTSWLVVGENGNLVPLNQALDAPPSPSGQAAGGALKAVVAEPTQTAVDPPWLAFTADSSVAVSGTGVPGTPNQIESGLQITTAEFFAGNVYIGTADGRVGVASYGPNPSFNFVNLFSGAAVTKLVNNGTDFIALADNGQAHRFDGQGNAVGNAVQISSDVGRPLVGAYWSSNRWLIVVGTIGFVAFVDEALAPPRRLDSVFDGETVLDAAAGDGNVLLVGTSATFAVVDDRGTEVTRGTATGNELRAASWNGENWLAVGTGGAATLIDDAGNPSGGQTLLDGNDIHFASWSGEFWLIGGDAGYFQFVRTDGTASGPPRQISEAASLHEARWSGRDWLVVGETPGGDGLVSLVLDDPNATPTVNEVATMGPLYAVDFNGIEWLVGGDSGLIHRVSAQGSPIDEPSDVLTGFDILDAYYNGNGWLIAGEFGAIRRLDADFLPVGAPIAVLDRADAASIEWTLPRGHASGACLTDELCYRGPCVGGIASGACCDRACDRPCESCFQDDTGEPDGTCAPVVADKRPPVKPDGASDPCSRQSEATCGFTGLCDGAGECQFYGAEIQCAESICSLGNFTPSASCTGTGACEMVTEVDCAPYAGCSQEGCLDSCNADEDCVGGFVCSDAGECVEESDGANNDNMPPGGDNGDGGDEDGGCCATANGAPTTPVWLLAVVLGWFARRRRDQ